MLAHDQPLSLEIDAQPAYEFVLTLCVMSNPAHYASYDLGSSWFTTVRAQATTELLAAVEAFCRQSDKVWAHLLSLVYSSPPPRDVPTFLAYLVTVDAMEVRLRLLGYYLRYFRRATLPEIIAAAAAGNGEAQRQFLKTSYPADDDWQAALQALLPLDAETTKSRLLEILQRWYEVVFRALEPQVQPILLRDAEAKEALARTMPPEMLIERVLSGWEYVPEPGIRQVLLVPSYILRPLNHSIDHQQTRIFCYPVADESITVGGDAPPARLLRLAKALGDERRLRILKRLTTGDYTLQELANHFGIGNTTVLHHMVILRTAGLVRLRGGAGKRYSLRRETLPDVMDLMDEYLQ